MNDMAETASPPQSAEGSTRDVHPGVASEVGPEGGSEAGSEAGDTVASETGSTPGKAASLETVLSLRDATLGFADRTLWSGLDLDVHAGEFIAVLGANGSGKTSLLRVILGQQKLQAGSVEFLGEPVASGNRRIGYIPQQRLADEDTPLRARDLVGLGVDGHRWGVSWPSKRRRALIDGLLDAVGAASYAKVPIATLSGGEQQRLRVGQALAGDPRMLLCDEPLLSLDLTHQRAVSELIDRHRRERQLGVLFVTHDINPVLDLVDRVLYLAGGKFRIGTPDQVLRSEVLSELYGSPVDVIRTRGRIVVVGTADAPQAHPDGSHAHHDEQHDPAHDAEPTAPFARDSAAPAGAVTRTWRNSPDGTVDR